MYLYYFLVESNHFIQLITNATRGYVECKHSNCSCYNKVINDDLKPFKGGITQQMIDKIRDR